MTNESALVEGGTPITTSVTGLTQFKEQTAQTDIDDCQLFGTRIWSNPFATRTPDFLKRSYLIASITWTSASTITWIPLIGALSQTTAALAVWKLYALARCCFKIDFKLTSSIYHQGSAVVGWLPCINTTTVPQTLQQCTGYHATIISAAKQDSVSMLIPFCSPEDWFPTSGFTSTSNEHASVFFRPLNTLLTTTTSIAASIPVEIWASIEECDLSGAKSQMAKKNAEAAAKEQKGKDEAVGSVIRNTSQLVRRVPVIGAVWSPIADVINTIFGTQLSKPVTTAAASNMMFRYASDVTQADGVTEASTLSLYQNPRTAVGPTLFGMDSTYMSLRKIAGTPLLFDTIGFNGTTVVAWSTSVLPSQVGSVIVTQDYLCSTVRLIKFYRGSIKYLFQFIMPGFYACRFRLKMYYGTVVDPGDVPSMVFDVKGDTIISITAPMLNYRAWFDKTNSSNLIGTLMLEQITGIIGSPSPTVAIIYCNVFRAGAEDLQFAVPTDVFSSAFKGPETRTYANNEDLSGAKKQMNLRKAFSVQFDPIALGQCFTQERNAVMAEEVQTLLDLLKRPATGYTVAQLEMGITSTLSAHKLIMSHFMFYRGSVVYRHMHLGNTTTHNDGWYLNLSGTTTNKLDVGWAAAYQAATPMWQTEAINVPWYCAVPYVPSALNLSYIHTTSTKVTTPILPKLALATPDTVTLSAGDDFMGLFLVPWGTLATDEAPRQSASAHSLSGRKYVNV